MLTRSAEADYAELCSLDVLCLKEGASNMVIDIYQRFKNQLGRNEQGWFDINILWKQLVRVNWESEFNNDKDTKRVLDKEAETTNKKDHTNMPWMPEIPHNCICSPYTRSTTARKNK